MKQALPQSLDLRLMVGGWARERCPAQAFSRINPCSQSQPGPLLAAADDCPGDRLSLPGWISVGLTSQVDGCRLTINFLPEAAHLQLSGQEMTFWLVFHMWAPLFIK